MFAYQGRTALVTGASSGIGADFARALAAKGMNLVLTARSEAVLRTMADELSQQHGVQTHVAPADLSRAEAVAEVTTAVAERGLAIDLLINNAAFLTHGRFESINANLERDELMVNVVSVVGL